MNDAVRVVRYTPEVVHKSVTTGVSYGVAEMHPRDHGAFVTHADYRVLEEHSAYFRKEWNKAEGKIASLEEELASIKARAADDTKNAELFRKISAAFDGMKTSTSERFLDCIGIDGDVCASLGALIDTARKEPK